MGPLFFEIFFILYLVFFLSSCAKSTTPPLSNLIFLKIILSSAFGPLLDNIAKETYKNLLCGIFFIKGDPDLSCELILKGLLFLLLLLLLIFKLLFSSYLFGLLFFLDNKILLNLFIFDKTLNLLVKISSAAPGKVTWEDSIKTPLLFLFGS